MPPLQTEHNHVGNGPGEALLGQVGQKGLVLALALSHYRGQHLEPGALLQLKDAVDDLLGGCCSTGVPSLGHFPDPESPVKTISCSRGSSTVRFLRLCSRAPLMSIDSVDKAPAW